MDRECLPRTIFFGIILYLSLLSIEPGGMVALQAQEQIDSGRPRQIEPGSRKRSVKPRALTAKDQLAAEQRLADLGYWTGRIDGQWDNASHYALIAFQKVEGLKPTGRLTPSVFEV